MTFTQKSVQIIQGQAQEEFGSICSGLTPLRGIIWISVLLLSWFPLGITKEASEFPPWLKSEGLSFPLRLGHPGLPQVP